MLRIAVPNKGTLSESAVEMLREAGYATRRDSKELIVSDADNDVEFFYLRPRDIAIYVGSGTVDAGVTGRDLLLDSASRAVEVMTLGFGRSTFRYAARPGDVARGRRHRGQAGWRPAIPASSRRTSPSTGCTPAVVRLDGAVETAITLGVADVIADVVETGATLRSQGLAVFGEPILDSEAVLIRRDDPAADGRRRATAGSRCCGGGCSVSSPRGATSCSTTTCPSTSSTAPAPSPPGSSRPPSPTSRTDAGARCARWCPAP